MTWVSFRSSRRGSQLVDGRVHHDRFEFHIDNAVLYYARQRRVRSVPRTRRPSPDAGRVARADKRLAAFQGMTVEIPIGGTLSRPRLDAEGPRTTLRPGLRQTANRLLEEGINRGLEQLLGPRR